MEEIWKPVVGYEGMYEVSNLGRVKSIKRNIIIKLGIIKGYNRIVLKGKTKLIHRLVSEAFIPNPENKPCVNHIDNNPLNNNINNLEWVTHKENSFHSSRQGRMNQGENQHNSKLTKDNVIYILKMLNDGIKGTVLAKKFNVTSANISYIKKGTNWKHIKV